MRSKSLYLVLAGICGVAAAAIASQWLSAQANSQPVGVSTEIFVAAVSIDVGEEITAQKVQLEKWPADKIPQGASGTLSEMEGKFAKQRFYVGEAIMPVKLMEENWSAVRKGYKAVAMKASEVDIANLIQPGDRVDVLAYFAKSELIPRSTTQTVLQGVRVYALDGDTRRHSFDDRPKSLRTIELLISENDAAAWTYANELGNIRLSLGSQEEFDGKELPNESGSEFLEWIEQQQQVLEEKTAAKERQLKQEFALLESSVRVPTEPSQPIIKTEPVNATVNIPPATENGFPMIKMVEGKLLEYWVVPGKLPVLRGPANPTAPSQTSIPEEIKRTADSTETKSGGTAVAEYSFLDGRKRPFNANSNGNGFHINDR